ncbi:Methyltransferase domain-containing protein [Spironucleus salmonicida]|uniref:Methyltransferase domain-containing protein n=1 Tax=Spironucleus salmonicida TaxID=348837 RepID=V6LNZ6_9EUKA|nr:Methyltransferase domain-containing protein [Spironucleus salmonicida]KAH0571663.1 Methyltransferase domain-containing protein [Spironucleus salmonicida]|eukprot:EST45441.1 Methyltransferase domain-containing protein [Spironucleus salmonicida]
MDPDAARRYLASYPFLGLLLLDAYPAEYPAVMAAFDAEAQLFLERLTPGQVSQLLFGEHEGAVPAQLQRFMDDSVLPRRTALPRHPDPKGAQVASMVAVVRELLPAGASVLDAGCGVGKLSQALDGLGCYSVLGVDRDAALVARASALGLQHASFAVRALGPAGLPATTALIALHGCGDFGADVLDGVESALVLQVPCCYQSMRHFPRSRALGGLSFEDQAHRRAFLNLACGSFGMDVGRILAKRLRRAAMQPLVDYFRDRHGLQPGQAICKRSRRDEIGTYLAEQVGALKRKAGCARPAEAIVRDVYGDFGAFFRQFCADNRQRYLVQIFLSGVCARTVELIAITDRAARLQERGYRVHTRELCAEEVTPRNVLLVGERE